MRNIFIIIAILSILCALYGEMDGFPVGFGIDDDISIWGSPAFVQLDTNCIIVCGSTNDTLYGFGFDGSTANGFPIYVGGVVHSKIAWTQIDSSIAIFVLTCDGILSRIDWDGTNSTIVFDTTLGESSNYISPVLADIDEDGTVDIIAAVDTILFCLDIDGNVLWNANFISSTGFAVATPSCGDIDGDGFSEITVEGYQTLNMFSATGDEITGFPIELDSDEAFSYSSALLFDYDKDGAYEIFCGLHRTSGAQYGIIKAFESDGSEIGDPFFTIWYSYGGWIYSSLSIGDADGDYSPDICFGNVPGELYAINIEGNISSFGGTGRDQQGHIYGSVLMCDLDGIPGPEYIFQTINESDSNSIMFVMDPAANNVLGFPDTMESSLGGILTPAICQFGETTYVSAITGDGNLHLWGIPNIPLPGYANWLQLYGDSQNRNVAPPANVELTLKKMDSSYYGLDWQMSSNPEFARYLIYLATDSAGSSCVLLDSIADIAETSYTHESETSPESLWFFVLVEDIFGRTSLRSVPKSTYDTTYIDEKILVPCQISLSISPNPFNSSCRIMWEASPDADYRDQKVSPTIEIFDLRGNVVVGAGSQPAQKGHRSGLEPTPTNRTFIWQPDESISSGIYLVRVTYDGKAITKKIAYLK
ncbi:T9SS type A sorting domain-containing protein [bacterium]|nr:T9SS type A sorting domain-containing protein [bacterium]